MRTLRNRHVRILLSYLDLDTFEGKRNALLLLLLSSTGLRASEVEKLNIEDVFAEGGACVERLVLPAAASSTGERREFDLLPLAQGCLDRWKALREEQGVDSPALLVDGAGKRWRASDMEAMFDKLQRRAGFSPTQPLSALRAVCGHRLYLRGATLFDIADQLGLKTLGSVLSYVPVGEREAVDQVLGACDRQYWTADKMKEFLHYHFRWWSEERCNRVMRRWSGGG